MKLDGSITKEKTIYCKEEDMYLHYHLSSGRADGERTTYDLEIEQIAPSGREYCCLPDIATSFAMAERIWQLFTEGTVTPITAQDILEQLLSDAAFLYEEYSGKGDREA